MQLCTFYARALTFLWFWLSPFGFIGFLGFFTYADGKVYVQTSRESVKVRNLKGNNNVALVVYRGEEAAMMRGKGRVIDSEKEFAKRTQEHVDKYHLQLDAQGRDSLGIPLFNEKMRCVIEVTPKRTIFW